MFNVTMSPQFKRGRSDVRDLDIDTSVNMTESPSKITAPSSNVHGVHSNKQIKLRVMDRKQSDHRSPIHNHNLPHIHHGLTKGYNN